MAAQQPVANRRQRLRQQTLDEIRARAYSHLERGGPAALSLNAIAREMGMSGPAIYRYFASREQLLATLIVESFDALADALVAAPATAGGRSSESRLRALARAYREWALANPHRYRLIFGTSEGSGAVDPERILPAAQKSMAALLVAVSESAAGSAAQAVKDAPLRRQLAAWLRDRSPELELAEGTAAIAVLAWTRMHGIVSLEIDGFFDQMGVDPKRLYQLEVDRLIERAPP
jgi:AcrR family transcriptional regulator